MDGINMDITLTIKNVDVDDNEPQSMRMHSTWVVVFGDMCISNKNQINLRNYLLGDLFIDIQYFISGDAENGDYINLSAYGEGNPCTLLLKKTANDTYEFTDNTQSIVIKKHDIINLIKKFWASGGIEKELMRCGIKINYGDLGLSLEKFGWINISRA